MALHSTTASMLKESLDEALEAAKYCIDYKKSDPRWGQYNTGECLGYPAGILLFCIVDTIGSYYRKNTQFRVEVDLKMEMINSEGWEHFKILNSKYFNQNLSKVFLKELYNKFRSRLTHNLAMGQDTVMYHSNESLKGFKFRNIAFSSGLVVSGRYVHVVFIKELYKLCEAAIMEFKKDIDEVVPKSKQGKRFH